LFRLGAILAEFELCFQRLDLDVKAHNMFHHPASIFVAEFGPLPHVGGLEGFDHPVQGFAQAMFIREHGGFTINMNGGIVPGGNAFAILV
jgi:hypothetical protein